MTDLVTQTGVVQQLLPLRDFFRFTAHFLSFAFFLSLSPTSTYTHTQVSMFPFCALISVHRVLIRPSIDINHIRHHKHPATVSISLIELYFKIFNYCFILRCAMKQSTNIITSANSVSVIFVAVFVAK